MRIAILIISLTLLVSPALAVASPLDRPLVVAAAETTKKDTKSSGGKVVIKGKGGKVTDVQQKPKPKKK